MVRFQKKLYFWNENKKLDWMDSTNVQNLRKNSNANVLQIFAFALQMWLTIWAGKPDDKRNVFTLWQEFRSQCRGQIQMNTLNHSFNRNLLFICYHCHFYNLSIPSWFSLKLDCLVWSQNHKKGELFTANMCSGKVDKAK